MEREKNTGIMRVRMLGGFSISYEGAAVVFDRKSPAKFVQLFQLLMLHLKDGIDKAEPVSYTHLDVYKRQEPSEWTSGPVWSTGYAISRSVKTKQRFRKNF